MIGNQPRNHQRETFFCSCSPIYSKKKSENFTPDLAYSSISGLRCGAAFAIRCSNRPMPRVALLTKEPMRRHLYCYGFSTASFSVACFTYASAP